MHKPFHIFKRPTTKKGKFVYYVQFYDEDGERMTARSSGQTSRAAATIGRIMSSKKAR
jgi:hypothetical protein